MILKRLRSELEQRLGHKVSFLPPPSHVGADLSLSLPLSLSKTLRRPPLKIAEEMSVQVQGAWGVERAFATPPGFLNVSISLQALTENLEEACRLGRDYSRTRQEDPRKILLEFVSANPTGPLHLGHGRGAALGDALARIFKHLGHSVSTEFYVNDAGEQIRLLGESLKARFLQLRGNRDAAVPDNGYHGQYLIDLAGRLPEEASGWKEDKFARHAVEVLLEDQKRDLKDFRVGFDFWFFESQLHQQKELEKTLEDLRKKGFVHEKDGAVWFGAAVAGEAASQDQEDAALPRGKAREAEEKDKDRVLVRSDGRPTYFLPDIAYHRNKISRGFDRLIDIWGADHHGYVPRMKAAMAALGHPEALSPIIYQIVHLFRGKEPVKMSKRAGEFVTLREVMQEVGTDACRWFFACRTPHSHLDFDLELAKKQSSENPVYYVQYVHARIHSIFREAEKKGFTNPESRIPNPALLKEPEERALMIKLAWLPEVLESCARDLSPHHLTVYLLELAGLFHPFYEKCRVVDENQKELSFARLALCRGVQSVIAEGLAFLGISSPERM